MTGKRGKPLGSKKENSRELTKRQRWTVEEWEEVEKASSSTDETPSDFIRNAALARCRKRLDNGLRLCGFTAIADGYVTKNHFKGDKNMEKKLIDKMVDRFLCWKLPVNFAPDCGISFDNHNGQCQPVGTNLFTAEQAKQMLQHVTAEPENERMNCENCNQVYEREYSNGGKQCFGLVKDTFRDCDVIRACQKYDNGKMFLQDLAPDEAAEMATGYAAVVRTWFSFFYQRPCGTCEKKESDCNVAE